MLPRDINFDSAHTGHCRYCSVRGQTAKRIFQRLSSLLFFQYGTFIILKLFLMDRFYSKPLLHHSEGVFEVWLYIQHHCHYQLLLLTLHLCFSFSLIVQVPR